MNIKPRALMIGAGVAAAILIATALCNQLVTYLTYDPTLVVTPSTDPNELLAQSGLTLVISGVACLVLIAAYIIGGYLYSHMHANEDPMLQMQDGVVGGAITGAVAGIIYGIVSACLGVIMSQLLYADAIAEVTAEFGNVPGASGLLGASAGLGGLTGICCGVVMGLFLGAVGGAIGASVRGRK